MTDEVDEVIRWRCTYAGQFQVRLARHRIVLSYSIARVRFRSGPPRSNRANDVRRPDRTTKYLDPCGRTLPEKRIYYKLPTISSL